MKIRHAAWLAAAVLAAPVLAQTQVQSASGIGVTSSTGIGVTPGATATVATAGLPNTAPQARLPGGSVVLADSQTTVSGNQKTTVTTYWANVPANVQNDAGFRRWQALK